MIENYNDLLLRVQQVMSNDDSSEVESVRTLKLAVSMGEKRIYREVRSRYNQKAFSAVTVTGNLAPIPDDFEACSVVHFGGRALQPVTEEWLLDYLDASPSGECQYFAPAGNSLMFGPAVADGTALQGRYYFRHPDLSAATYAANDLVVREPDLFLYASLTEAAPMFERMQQLPFWESKYAAIRDRLNKDAQYTAGSAGRMRVRPSTRLMR